DPKDQSTSFTYNLAGDLVTLTDARDNVTEWEYDTEGRVTTKTYADSTFYEYSWYPDGKLHTRKDAKGATTSYTWNALGLLTLINYPSDTDVSYTYDTFGNRTGMTDATGSTSWGYDAYKRLVSENGPFADNDTVTYSYSNGQRYVSSTPEHTLSYGFDPMGRIASVSVTDGPTFAYSYLNRSRQIATVSRGGQVVVDNSYDTLGRLTGKVNKDINGNTISSYAYELDDANRRTKITLADGRYWDYTYDDAGENISLAKTQRTLSYE
ncbi:MAG TPA: hypothetical protein P5161_06945, partial [Eubacteriales bacterium]|nr:hypothetical protein [Eubacteriales bacterium]